MSKWKNVTGESLIFGGEIVHPGQSVEVEAGREPEVRAIPGFQLVGGEVWKTHAETVFPTLQDDPAGRNPGSGKLDPGFGLDPEGGKGDE